MLGICVMLFGKPFHQGTLVVSELCRNLHCDMRHQIATLALVVKMRDAQILQGHSVVRLASCRHSHRLLAIERVDFQIMPQYGPAHRHLDPAVQIITVTSEGVILSDADVDIQVAGNTAVFTHLALISETPAGTDTPT